MEEFAKIIKHNREIPIIGKGTKKELEERFYRLVSKNFKVIEITLRSENSFDTVTSAFSFCSAPATRPQNDHT